MDVKAIPEPEKATASSEKPAITATASDKTLINIHDPSISFEEFRYWAEVTREDELHANRAFAEAKAALAEEQSKLSPKRLASQFMGHGDANVQVLTATTSIMRPPPDENFGHVTEAEWKQASRALRSTSWVSCFYLIIADVINMYSTPWAFAQTGYGPGIALYTVFGAMAWYSAWVMWKTFLGLDSDRYPMRTYGDLWFRLFGPAWRHATNVGMSVQMLLLVATVILIQGQAISQVSQVHMENGVCFVACLIIFMVAVIILSQIRSLHSFSWVATGALWFNVVVICICLGVVAHSPPNFKATQASFGKEFGPGPIRTFGGQPPPGLATGGAGFIGSLNGLNQAVLSYSGCLTFISFMAEMRHPMDFWKALACAQILIWAIYTFFGVYVYAFQGQFAFNPVTQGLSPYKWQTAANVLGVIVGLICTSLYANIGLKIVYVEVFQEVLGFPPLTKRKGRIAWAVTVPVYIIVGFVIATGVPQLSYVSGLIAALFGMTFTYTLPGIMAIAYWVRKEAMLPEEKFNPHTRTYNFVDSGASRWIRAFKMRPFFYSLNFIYVLGAIVTTVLGVYSSILGLIDGFSGKNVATSFGCTPPV